MAKHLKLQTRLALGFSVGAVLNVLLLSATLYALSMVSYPSILRIIAVFIPVVAFIGYLAGAVIGRRLENEGLDLIHKSLVAAMPGRNPGDSDQGNLHSTLSRIGGVEWHGDRTKKLKRSLAEHIRWLLMMLFNDVFVLRARLVSQVSDMPHHRLYKSVTDLASVTQEREI